MSTDKKTVLLVDDDPDFILQQKVQFEAAGYEVITASGRKKAEELLETTTPDIAIVDLMMEEMDGGFQLSYHIKRSNPDLPVILLTGVASETGITFDAATDEEKSWVRADAFVSKPVRFDLLLADVEKFLNA